MFSYDFLQNIPEKLFYKTQVRTTLLNILLEKVKLQHLEIRKINRNERKRQQKTKVKQTSMYHCLRNLSKGNSQKLFCV